MAQTKYQNQESGGIRISTNGYYTGHHKGSVMQDAAGGADNKPYYVERTTIRYGTITQDAVSSSMPTLESGSGSSGDSGDSGAELSLDELKPKETLHLKE